MRAIYNRYIPQGEPYERIVEEESPPFRSQEVHGSRQAAGGARRPPPKGNGPLEGIAGRLGGLLKNIHLDGLDSGDILLVLILLFLFLESDDNLELVITLGLLLLFGLFEKDKDEETREREEEEEC